MNLQKQFDRVESAHRLARIQRSTDPSMSPVVMAHMSMILTAKNTLICVSHMGHLF